MSAFALIQTFPISARHWALRFGKVGKSMSALEREAALTLKCQGGREQVDNSGRNAKLPVAGDPASKKIDRCQIRG